MAVHASSLIFEGHFDDGVLDPARVESFVNSSGSWEHDESQTRESYLSVRDIENNADQENLWRVVHLTRFLAQPVGDFSIEMDISWDSSDRGTPNPDARALGRILVGAHCADGSVILNHVGYAD